jgi:RHS repeat-associated protein
VLLALEGREAPQLVLPLAVGAAAGAAVVGQMLVNPPSAQAAGYVDVSVTKRAGETSPEWGRAEILAGQGTSSQRAEMMPRDDAANDDFTLVASLDSTPVQRGSSPRGFAPAGGEEMPALEQTSAPGALSSSIAPSLAPFGGSPAQDAPSSDGPTVSSSSTAPNAANARQGPQPQAASPAPTLPVANSLAPTLPNGAASNELNALAHELATSAGRGSAGPTLAPPILPLAGPLSPSSGPGIFAVGPDAGAAPTVRVYDPTTLQLKFTINAYDGSMTGGVRVAVGDVNGDGTPDIITAPGKGGGSLVKVFSSVDGSLLQSFNAYAPGQTDGVFVAAGDVEGVGHADIITGTDVGAKPLVKVFKGTDDSLLSSFISDPLAGANGVRVAAGDVDGDGKADIITAAGPGGPPRVTVVDGVTDKEIHSFFAYDIGFKGGVYVAAGDLDGDGKADIVTGPGAGMAPEVRTFDGATLRFLGNVTAFDPTFTGGVRVGLTASTSSGKLDIFAGQGPTGGTVRSFDGRTLKNLNAFTPFGPNFSKGLFVAGDGLWRAPPGSPGDPIPTVTVAATTPATTDQLGAAPAVFTISRTGDTSQQLQVNFSGGGTALVGTDWSGFGAGSVNILAGQSSATVSVTATDDNKFDGPEVVVLNLNTSANYNIGNPGSAIVLLIDSLPVDVPQDGCGCGGGGGTEKVSQASGVGANPVSEFGDGPVRLFDGNVKAGAAELSSSGFGIGWGQDRSWTNGFGYANTSFAGNGSVLAELPYLQKDGSGDIALISNGTTARVWDTPGMGVYNSRYFLQETLSDNTMAGEFSVTDTAGDVLKFYDFGGVPPPARQGLFKSLTDPDGNTTTVTSWTNDKPAEVQRSNTTNGVTVVESYLYTFTGSTLSNVTLRRGPSTTGPWTTVRQSVYTYDANNNLKLSKFEDAAGNVLDTRYARFYATGDANGYAGGLKYSFGPQSYARLVAALGTNVDALTDAQVAPYADLNLQYDAWQRVTQATVQGAGCSACGSGLGTFSYTYTPSAFADGYNNWRLKTVETLPDNNQNIVYTNEYGEVMLRVFKDATTGNQWATFYKYDNAGRLIWTASPSAVTGYDDTTPDLLNNQSGNYQYLSNSTGLITVTDYGTSTTATSSTAGDVTGYYKDTKVQQGQLGTAILQSQTQYLSQTAGGITIYPVGAQTVYRNTDGSGGETTSYSYTFFTGTNQVQSMTVTKPVITTAENGPGGTAADVATTFYDLYARPIWTKDGDGFITYTEYDQATGAVDKTITDVNTNNTSDFMNLPTGWMTPTGGGLHLKTLLSVDSLGRTTKLTDPVGDITYTVYLDTNYEVRTYPGWNSTNNLPTGPIQDSREDRPGSYMENLTFSTTPHLTNNVPDGTETIANIQSLSRSYSNNAGQLVRSDAYFSLSGVAYSTNKYIGTQNTNYYTTLTDYDTRGRQNRVQLPTGTINRTVYDGLSRVVSTWTGTNDTPAMGTWSPTNNTAPANMVQITGNSYDTATAPAGPALGQVAGGTLPATTYYVKFAYVYGGPAAVGSAESVLAVAANNLLTVTAPSSVAGATGYNVYAGTASGKETLQNTTPLAFSSNWTEATTGLTNTGEFPFTPGIGDSLLTQSTQYPGGSAANRVTNNYYDWRDRLVATKSGVQASEDTTTHRPILYYTLDNLSETTQVDRYDGDTVTVTSSGGVPQAPSSSLLRARTASSYDEQGRVYLTQVYSVNPSTGAVSTTSLNTNTWFNHRGLVIETSQPGGLKTKNAYDGAGRTTITYTTDGNGDAAPGTANSWANAGTVSTTNNVLVQVETSYDADSNVLLTTTRQRNHDETTGGQLGNETTTPKARVSFVADYYDLANRLTTMVDVGTNGTGTYTRPSTPPAASDTVLRTDTSYAGDNVQQVTLTGSPTGGTFTLTFNGQTTSAIAYNASASSVQSAFQSLSSVGSGNALVASPTGSGWVIRFAGTLAGSVQASITGNGSGLTGGTNPAVSITVTSLGGDAGRVQQVTDPRGLITKTDTDWLGRTVRTVEAFSTFNPSSSSDKTTEYTYDGSNQMLTLQADLAGSAYEQTKWLYGVTTPNSGVNSNDILGSMQYPNKTTGNPSSSEQETYTVNALGQRIGFTDRNGNVHSYLYDVLGRQTSDQITTLGSGVDNAILRIDTAYDTQGNAYLFTSYSTTAGTTIVNQVQRAFNGFAQLTQEWQSHSGAVNTSTTPSIQYAYGGLGTGDTNTNQSRLTSITYPTVATGSRGIITYNYASGLDDAISRLTSLSDNGGNTLETYSYLGLGTVVKRAHPSPMNGLDLTYNGTGTGDAGDKYTGLDRFGRIVEQKWQTEQMTPTVTDDFTYTYDRDNNRLSRTNNLNTAFNETYGYDNLNQLTSFARGTHTITYSLDAVGNFASTTTDGGNPVSNTFNKQNEETQAGTANLNFDNNGNTTTDDQGKTLVYDAWNRLVAYKSGSTTLESYSYDALTRRIVQNPGTATDLYYSSQWEVLEERTGGVSTATIQYVWSPVYVDALVLRDRSTQNNGTLDERLWVQQDANWNITALLSTSSTVVERYLYDPYGKQTILDANWNIRSSSSYAFVYGFQGARLYTSSGLYYERNRDLSPSLGRWTRLDPLNFAGRDPNFYRAFRADPVVIVDPFGAKAIAPAGVHINKLIGTPLDPIGIFFECTTFPIIADIPFGADVPAGGGTVIYRLFRLYQGRAKYWQPLAWPNSVWREVYGALTFIEGTPRWRGREIDIFGWSRGGIEAMTLAHKLAELHKDVRFMGLIDPVRTGGLQMWGTATSVPYNVGFAFIAMALVTGFLGDTIFDHTIPETQNASWVFHWYHFNHQQIGWSDEVYNDMRASAISHGVPFL